MVPLSGAIKSSSVRNLCSDTASVWATRRAASVASGASVSGNSNWMYGGKPKRN